MTGSKGSCTETSPCSIPSGARGEAPWPGRRPSGAHRASRGSSEKSASARAGYSACRDMRGRHTEERASKGQWMGKGPRRENDGAAPWSRFGACRRRAGDTGQLGMCREIRASRCSVRIENTQPGRNHRRGSRISQTARFRSRGCAHFGPSPPEKPTFRARFLPRKAL